VVAEEVRNLAQRSADAAKNTSALIEQSQKNSERGVAVSEEVAEILKQIVEGVHKVTQLVGEVSAASTEQAKGIEQVTKAVAEMDKVTQGNAANAEESASASEELSAQAREVNEMVNVLIHIVEGEQRRSGAGLATAPKLYSRTPESNSALTAVKTESLHVRQKAGELKKAAKRLAHDGKSAVKPSKVVPLTDAELGDF